MQFILIAKLNLRVKILTKKIHKFKKKIKMKKKIKLILVIIRILQCNNKMKKRIIILIIKIQRKNKILPTWRKKKRI